MITWGYMPCSYSDITKSYKCITNFDILLLVRGGLFGWYNVNSNWHLLKEMYSMELNVILSCKVLLKTCVLIAWSVHCRLQIHGAVSLLSVTKEPMYALQRLITNTSAKFGRQCLSGHTGELIFMGSYHYVETRKDCETAATKLFRILLNGGANIFIYHSQWKHDCKTIHSQ